jgi:hypothetical protein
MKYAVAPDASPIAAPIPWSTQKSAFIKRGRLYFLRDSFGEVIIGPRTLRGDRGMFTQMRIEDPYSLDLLRENLHGTNTEEADTSLNSV